MIDETPQTMAMKLAERNEWVAALRGELLKPDGTPYVQGFGVLSRKVGTKGYEQCCLGVKCLLDVAAGRYGLSVEHAEWAIFMRPWEQNMTTMPSQSLADEWGVTQDQIQTLAKMNDRYQYEFEVIADWIVQNVEVEVSSY